MPLWLKQWGVCQGLASTNNERVSSGRLRRMLLHFLGFFGGQPFASECVVRVDGVVGLR
jgi:hypothetical protein